MASAKPIFIFFDWENALIKAAGPPADRGKNDIPHFPKLALGVSAFIVALTCSIGLQKGCGLWHHLCFGALLDAIVKLLCAFKEIRGAGDNFPMRLKPQ